MLGPMCGVGSLPSGMRLHVGNHGCHSQPWAGTQPHSQPHSQLRAGTQPRARGTRRAGWCRRHAQRRESGSRKSSRFSAATCWHLVNCSLTAERRPSRAQGRPRGLRLRRLCPPHLRRWRPGHRLGTARAQRASLLSRPLALPPSPSLPHLLCCLLLRGRWIFERCRRDPGSGMMDGAGVGAGGGRCWG